MKFEVDRDSFCAVLARAAGVASKATGMPILRNVLLSAEMDKPVEMAATDLEISLRAHAQAIVHAPGRITVPAREMLAIMRGLWEQRATVELSENMLQIMAGKSKRKIACIPAEGFPAIDPTSAMAFGPCDKAELSRAIAKTFFVIPSESNGFNISGAFIHKSASGDQYRMVSVDGHRLSWCGIGSHALSQIEVGAGIVVPRKGLQEIMKILEAPGDAAIACDGVRLAIKTDEATLIVQLLDPAFPTYEDIIPAEERPFSIGVDAQRLHGTLVSMMPLFVSPTKNVRFHIGQNRLTLQSVANPQGEAEDQIEIDYGDEEISLYFNAKYWIEALKAMDGKARIEWIDGFHGAILLDDGDKDCLNLIMPMVN